MRRVNLKMRLTAKIFSIIAMTALFVLMAMDIFSQELEKSQCKGYYSNGLWGYVNKSSRMTVISCKYEEARDFSEGLAAVQLSGYWGFIDKIGREVIPFKYKSVRDFSGGYAMVFDGKFWGAIDKNGAAVVSCTYENISLVNAILAGIIEKEHKREVQMETTLEQEKTVLEYEKTTLEREKVALEREKIALERERMTEQKQGGSQRRNETNRTQIVNQSNRIFRFGPHTGMNFTNMSGLDGISKMLFGVQSGIVVDFSLPKSFAIQSGLLYAQQGFRATAVYMNQKSTYKITLHYIQIPINAQYKLALGRNTSLLFQTGTYFGFCFWGTASDNGITVPIRMGYSEKDELKTFDFGLGLGVGVQFYGLQVRVGYNIGLYNLRPLYFSDKSRNHGLAITVTYLFGK